jgi:uncharacterized protein (TIGR00304 family)
VNPAVLYALGIALVATGIIIIVLSIILVSMRGAAKGKVKAAGIIMIGPIPIIFGTDKKSVKTVLALALALVIALIIYYWLLR